MRRDTKAELRYAPNQYAYNFLLGTPVDGAIAMKGEWPGENEFLLTVQDIGYVDLVKLSFQFTPPDVSIEWDVILLRDYLLALTGKIDQNTL
jgi:hypothetical protein